jgi:hypothetical protein
MKSANLVPAIKAALAESGLPAGSLELEVTESVMLQEDGNTLRVMSELHDLGLRISMDDFGTGYSSLGSLRKFPFDRIKIDRSFVSEMSERVDSLELGVDPSPVGGVFAVIDSLQVGDELGLVGQADLPCLWSSAARCSRLSTVVTCGFLHAVSTAATRVSSERLRPAAHPRNLQPGSSPGTRRSAAVPGPEIHGR